MRRLLKALERIATALEQLVPAVQQATREQRYEFHGTIPREGPCKRCRGTGFYYQHVAPWDGPSEACPDCEGSGRAA